ncbi:hypothetical protein [Halomarina oriensis]|uniref:Uncharacterized protein n=1 Tax=Halomarina oriensis TaxID=671145 RepID=A0A6B0GG37_9EURY|nr:hypothetical protein [Halomarina oriensis]MWG33782.1 hypothetical protein [Halomarina oriensis]
MSDTYGESFETTFVEESALDVGFSAFLAERFDRTPEEVEYPRDAPRTEPERRIGLARELILAGGNRTGFSHHTDVQVSLRRCEHPDVTDEAVRSIRIGALRTGVFSGETAERVEKADVILAWASTAIDDDVLQEIETDYAERVVGLWEAAAEDVEYDAFIDDFAEDPPDHVDGWTKTDVDHDDVLLAYTAVVHGTPVIAAIYENERGQRRAHEWTLENWHATGGDPHDTQPNRHILLLASELDVHDALYTHLTTYDGEPIPTTGTFKPTDAA